ncbi:MAG TPA: hypothetical protein VF796_09530 [Humisphaera sp.]
MRPDSGDGPGTVLGYQSAAPEEPPRPPPLPLVEWRTDAEALVLVVWRGPAWRPVAWVLLRAAAAALVWSAAAVVATVAYYPGGRASPPGPKLVWLAGVVGVAGWAAVRVRAICGHPGVGLVRADPDGLEVIPPPWAGRGAVRWRRADVAGVRCDLVGFARGLAERLRVTVTPPGDAAAVAAEIPWPPGTGMGDVEDRLRAALRLPVGRPEGSGGTR